MIERTTYDAEVDAAYFLMAPSIADGESVKNVVLERPTGTLILDFDDAGRLLGLEVSGARYPKGGCSEHTVT